MTIQKSEEFNNEIRNLNPSIRNKIEDILLIFSDNINFLLEDSIQKNDYYIYKINDFYYLTFSKKEDNIILKSIKRVNDDIKTTININNNKTISKKTIIWIVLILLFLIVFVFIWNYWNKRIENRKAKNPPNNIDSILSWFVYTWETNNVSWDNTVIIPIELTDYQKFLELSKKNTISLYSPNNPVYSSFDPSDWVWNTTKVENIRNKYAKYIQNPKQAIWTWYLYIIASVNNWILSEKESVYLYFGDFWGHLYKKYSLDVPSDDWRLHLLYPLDKIVFAKLPTKWYDDNKEMGILRTGNWQEKFNTTNNNIYFFWFVSTSRQWKLEEVRIVYE